MIRNGAWRFSLPVSAEPFAQKSCSNNNLKRPLNCPPSKRPGLTGGAVAPLLQLKETTFAKRHRDPGYMERCGTMAADQLATLSRRFAPATV